MDKKLFFCFFLGLLLLSQVFLQSQSLSTASRELMIENFDDGEIELESYLDEDYQPGSWSLDAETTMDNSAFSLKLYGNTWKQETISAIAIAEDDIWEVSCFIEDLGEIQAFGISDGENAIVYSLYGTQEMDIEEWFPVYQGSKPEGSWQQFLLPVADDWYSWYEYYPQITRLIFINDNDSGSGVVYFDSIRRVTEDLPQPPETAFYYELGELYSKGSGNRSIDVQFLCWTYDPDSDSLSYFWSFGDDSTSTEEDPLHTYTVEDDHLYTVMLEVTDDTGLKGYASCEILLEEGETSYPVTLNFVGDIMLARGYEQNGGIIQTQGVEAIFEPTMDILGNAADITVANLECPLTDHTEHHPTKTIYFKGDPANAAGLAFAGIDIVTLANNHIIDYNYPGLLETQQTLDDHGILHSGCGINSVEAYQPLFYNKKGVNFAFLASSDRTGQYNNYQPYLNAGYNKPGFAYMTPYYISEQIAVVEEHADLIVVEMHAGSEYSTGPGSNYDVFEPGDLYPDEDYHADYDIPHMWDIAIRHHAVEAGADLVIVHHPHIMQGLELYNGKLIAHSLGNFVFDLTFAETMSTFILATKVNETGFYEFSVTPVFIDDWIPQRATGELGLFILDDLAQKSKDMNTYLKIDRRNVLAEVIMDTLEMDVTVIDHEAELTLQLIEDQVISEPFRLVRDGSISAITGTNPNIDWQMRLGREKLWFGNFEQEGCSGWNINSDDEWLDETESYQGMMSLRLRRYPDSGDNVVTNLENRIKRYEADSYTLHGYIKTLNGAAVTIQVRYYNYRTGGYLIGEEDVGVQIDGDSDWTYFWQELEVPEDCNYFDIRASSDCPDEGEAFAWFDEVGLIAWETWQELETGAEIASPNDYYYLQIASETFCPDALISFQETSYEPGPVVDANENDIPLNKNVILKQNYPNPFTSGKATRKSGTKIDFSLLLDKQVTLQIYNIKGQLVKRLLDENLERGDYTVTWDCTDNYTREVRSGVYFYKIKAGKEETVKKMLLLK